MGQKTEKTEEVLGERSTYSAATKLEYFDPLRKKYEEILDEPIPDRWYELIQRLKDLEPD